MSFLSYVLLYLLGVVVSFFVIPKLIEFESFEANTLIKVSLLFPIFWIIVIFAVVDFSFSRLAEKYLEYINKDKSS